MQRLAVARAREALAAREGGKWAASARVARRAGRCSALGQVLISAQTHGRETRGIEIATRRYAASVWIMKRMGIDLKKCSECKRRNKKCV
jgi:hypothetical protein